MADAWTSRRHAHLFAPHGGLSAPGGICYFAQLGSCLASAELCAGFFARIPAERKYAWYAVCLYRTTAATGWFRIARSRRSAHHRLAGKGERRQYAAYSLRRSPWCAVSFFAVCHELRGFHDDLLTLHSCAQRHFRRGRKAYGMGNRCHANAAGMGDCRVHPRSGRNVYCVMLICLTFPVASIIIFYMEFWRAAFLSTQKRRFFDGHSGSPVHVPSGAA